MRQISRRAASVFSRNYSLSHSCRGAKVRLPPGRNKKSLLQFWSSVSETKQAKRYFVSGMVQGVGYRYYTLAAAEKLRVSGFVRNLRDGRVEVFAVGTPQQHRELRSMLERGPRFSSVSEVREEPAISDAQDRAGFFIDHTD
jgi:acylphosphatase